MSYTTKFILLLVLEIPAIAFSISIVVYLARNHHARSKLENHGWFVLLMVNLFQLMIDLPMPITYYHIYRVWFESNAYCIWWIWYEYSSNAMGLFLMAWISIERHLFIFHQQAILRVAWKKWVFHFIPIIFCLIWAPIFYIIVVIISPDCTTVWDFNSILCGIPCYVTETFLGQFDLIFNITVPIIIILLANVALVIRVIYQRMSHHQAINWRRHRKMVLQLYIISSLYMAFWLPLVITELIQVNVMPSFMIDQLETIEFVIYFIPLLLPMICLSTLPKLMIKIVAVIREAKVNVVGVTTVAQGARQPAIDTIIQ